MPDRSDVETTFETTFQRRLRAYATAGVHPVPVDEVVRSTLWAATTSMSRTSGRGGPRRSLLVGLAAILLLGTAGAAAVVERWPRSIEGVFTDGPSLPAGRRVVSAITLPDGAVLVGVAPFAFDNGTGTQRCITPCHAHLATWRSGEVEFEVASLPHARTSVEAITLLDDGRVLVFGNGVAERPRSAWIFDPAADAFKATGTPLEARIWPAVVPLEDGRILVAGGDSDGPLGSAELYDPATGRFEATGAMTQPRSVGMTATRLLDGRVLIVGGGADVGASADVYDPATGTFTATADQLTARGGFGSATLLRDGRVLLVGGLVPVPGGSQTLPTVTAAAEVYDPTTGTFHAVGSMAAPRFLHAAALLADGTVLVAGGGRTLATAGQPEVTATAEIFDPSSGAFRPTGDLLRPRLWPLAVAADERVLILGDLDPTGDDPDDGATTEWFE
jgi:hypothetical protein